MSASKKANEGAVTTIADDALVMAIGSNGYQPISFADLAKAVRGTLQIGGRNLLKGTYNGNGWSPKPTDGVYAISASTSTEVFLNGPTIPYEIGKTYTVSFCAKATPNVSSVDVFLSAQVGGEANVGSIKPTSDWTRYVFTKTISTQYNNRFRIDNNGSNNGQVSILWIKDIKVEEGNVATDYSIAPEDIATDLWGGGNWFIHNQLQFSRERRCA